MATRRTPRTRTPEGVAEAIEIRRLDGPLLCLDVSSTACGYAAFHADGHPFDFGVIRPTRGWESWRRIDAIVAGVGGLCHRVLPAAALMEWSDGHTHGRLARASGLAILGHAQGAVRQLLSSLHCPVAAVAENAWTRSQPKEKRAKKIKLLVPGWDAAADPGLDAAVALGLGFWLFDKARETEILRRAGEAV